MLCEMGAGWIGNIYSKILRKKGLDKEKIILKIWIRSV
jgi:hypothetical protein